VSQVDIFPTICELAGIAPPSRLQGRSLLPVMTRAVEEVNDAVFAEMTYHAAYEPMRAVRTDRWKYIRRFGDRLRPVLPNVDDSPAKDLLLAEGWAERELPREALYDLHFDPVEAHNLVDARPDVAEELRERLDAWMRETEDPLLDGPVPAPPGAELNDPDQVSPAEPAGSVH
jgi:N-sulfoglucosamine sulfohydrolase